SVLQAGPRVGGAAHRDLPAARGRRDLQVVGGDVGATAHGCRPVDLELAVAEGEGRRRGALRLDVGPGDGRRAGGLGVPRLVDRRHREGVLDVVREVTDGARGRRALLAHAVRLDAVPGDGGAVV